MQTLLSFQTHCTRLWRMSSRSDETTYPLQFKTWSQLSNIYQIYCYFDHIGPSRIANITRVTRFWEAHVEWKRSNFGHFSFLSAALLSLERSFHCFELLFHFVGVLDDVVRPPHGLSQLLILRIQSIFFGPDLRSRQIIYSTLSPIFCWHQIESCVLV